MRKIVVERKVIIKEVWMVPEVYELGADPMSEHGHRTSIRQIDLAPTTYRDWVPGESIKPCLGDRPHDRAERGYWSRLMQAWKQSLKG